MSGMHISLSGHCTGVCTQFMDTQVLIVHRSSGTSWQSESIMHGCAAAVCGDARTHASAAVASRDARMDNLREISRRTIISLLHKRLTT
jgi:hypothetical protein